MNKILYFLVFILNSSCAYLQENTPCKEIEEISSILIRNLDSVNYQKELEQLESYFNTTDCFPEMDKAFMYIQVAEKLYDEKIERVDYLSKYVFKALRKGMTYGDLFGSPIAIYIEENDFYTFQQLLTVSDSVLIEQCKDFENVSYELTFLIFHMLRTDQKIRYQEIIARDKGDNHIADSLLEEMKEVDRANQLFLSRIFDTYRKYPGFSLVGHSQSSAFIIYHHAGIDFKIKYFPLVFQAVKNKDLVIDLKFTIDRIVHHKFGVQLYGNRGDKVPIEKDPEKVAYYLKEIGAE